MSRRLARNLARVKPGTVFVGVDLAVDRNVAVVIDERARRLARFRFSNDRNGYLYFLRRIESVCDELAATGTLVGMEPTNYFWKLLAGWLEGEQIEYRLVNPYTVRKRREGDQLDRSKDDPRDAFMIADLLRTGKYTETRLLHGGYAELRQSAILYGRIGRDIRRHKNVLRAAVGQLFPELRQVFKDLTGDTALAMLRNHATAAVVCQMPLDVFIDKVRNDLGGSRLAVSKLYRAHVLARGSVGLREGFESLQQTIRMEIETLALLQRQLDQAQSGLLGAFSALPEAPSLSSVPYLGKTTAAIILAEIGDPRNYSNAAQLIKLAGTQPTPNTSGQKSKSSTPISRKGRPALRSALYFGSLRLVQRNEVFAQNYRYLQERRDNPLTKMQALVVIMNKLLRILWALMRTRTLYDPAVHAATCIGA